MARVTSQLVKPISKNSPKKKITPFLNKIICGDAIEVMQQLPDECIDLVVTSPP